MPGNKALAMTRHAELSGVAHNIAHHSGSGLSCISPHLANALRSVGAESTEIDLLVPQPYPPVAADSHPLRLALATLRQFVLTLLEKHGFGKDEIATIVLYATPAPWDRKGYSLHTRAAITSTRGGTYDSGWLG